MTRIEITPRMQILSYVAQLTAAREKVSKTTVSKELHMRYSKVENLVLSLEDAHLLEIKYEYRDEKSYAFLLPTSIGKELLKKCYLPPYGSPPELTPPLQVLSYIAQLSAIGEKVGRKKIHEDLGLSKSSVDNALGGLRDAGWTRTTWEYDDEQGMFRNYHPSKKGETVLRKSEFPPYG
jgi:DNA-binding MarR family transcriptional regulator